MPVILDIELSTVTITRRREPVVIPDVCPNIECGKPLTGPAAVYLLFKGLDFCEQSASIDQDEAGAISWDDGSATSYVGGAGYNAICCYACGGVLHGAPVIFTEQPLDVLPPPEVQHVPA